MGAITKGHAILSGNYFIPFETRAEVGLGSCLYILALLPSEGCIFHPSASCSLTYSPIGKALPSLYGYTFYV